MAKTSAYPYIPSPGLIVQTFSQLRRMFPQRVDAEVLRKLSLAPKNESMVINVLRFLGLVDEESKKTDVASKAFSKHDDVAFATELESIVKTAYGDLFETMGDDAWASDRSSLIGFFRVHDETSEITATRQAIAFETLASLSGHGESVRPKAQKSRPQGNGKKGKTLGKAAIEKQHHEILPGAEGGSPREFGLTVRVEINLPAQGDQDTYDRIFKSIKENLLNG